MKKRICALLILALLCALAACAEAGDAETIRCEIEDGSYVIRIPDAEGDLGWVAGETTGDDPAVRLAGAELEDGSFVVRYAPVGDGDVTVDVRHYTGIACDEMHTWDLSVRDGAVQACTGGSYTASPDPSEMDPYLIGAWQTGDGMAAMAVEKNPAGRGWDVEIAGAEAHGGYVFKTTIYYDCALDSFVYDKGKYWETPITDGSGASELGEAKISGATGAFRFEGEAAALCLRWSDAERPEALVFGRQQAAAASAAQEEVIRRFSDTWVIDGFSAEIWYDEEIAAFTCSMALEDGSFCDFTDCAYDAEADALVCRDGSRFFADYNEETLDYDYDVVETGLTAVFTLRGGTLTCEGLAGVPEGAAFLRLSDAEDADVAAEASRLYTQADMDEAVAAILEEFSGWTGCELHGIRYAGDGSDNAENRAWLSELREKDYTACMEFLSDFHSPVEGGGAWEADAEYTDWQWWLARAEGGSWELVTWGY